LTGIANSAPNENTPNRPPLEPSLGLLSEMHQRLTAVEASQADIHAKIDAATKAGTLDPELLERTAHIVQKYFPHDVPDKTPAPAPLPKFDAFTGQPLN
jgi:hypothetical protein